MTVPRRIVPVILLAAACVGAWAGLQLYTFFAGG